MMIESTEFFSRWVIAGIVVVWLVGLLLFWWLRARCGRRLDRLGESSSEEMLDELRHAYPPQSGTTIRTHAEYLPYVIECIREQIDAGLDDPQVRLLLERIENHRPGEERHAVFTVERRGAAGNLSMRWKRDPQDRVTLHVRGDPAVIRALRRHRKTIPRAKAGANVRPGDAC